MEKILSHFYKDCSLRIAARPLGKYGTKMALDLDGLTEK